MGWPFGCAEANKAMKRKMVKKMFGFIVVAADGGANGLWIMDLETTDYTDYTDFNHE